jgi:diguanylate cyclase (GGDEF)-like protein
MDYTEEHLRCSIEELKAASVQRDSIIRKTPVRLVVSDQQPPKELPTFHRETTLESIAAQLGQQRYVIATNDQGRIAGFASQDQIQQRLQSANRFERTRWEQMPLGALVNVAFCDSEHRSQVPLDGELECVAISENNKLFGISVNDDVFLSWSRVESLLSVALSDPLTGLPNRLSYERRLAEEWNRAQRTNVSVAVVVIDMNGFKLINDTYGHLVGDQVLSSVACQLESSMRSYDVVARLGGDEFVALCLGCDPGRIAIPVQRILQSLSQIDMSIDGTPIRPTASIGAAVRHDGFAETTPCELFEAADDCLYRAKGCTGSAWIVELGARFSGTARPVSEMCGGSNAESQGHRLAVVDR